MMSTPSITKTAPSPSARQASASGLVPYRVSVRQFEKMIGAGVFGERDHVELLEGILVDKMTKRPPHNFTVTTIADTIRAVVGSDWVVREEKSVVLGRFSRPEPDVAIARGPRDRYRSVSPSAADLAALIEAADTSYAKDRGSKWRKYAASKIPVYWIVNLPLRQIEVYTEPSGRGKTAAYQVSKVYGEDDEVPIILGGRELGRLKVRDVLS
jgi:Uma2 family endonuclease